MGMLNKNGFKQLIVDDIAWVKKQGQPTTERAHVLMILERIADLYYDKLPPGFERWVEADHGDYAKR